MGVERVENDSRLDTHRHPSRSTTPTRFRYFETSMMIAGPMVCPESSSRRREGATGTPSSAAIFTARVEVGGGAREEDAERLDLIEARVGGVEHSPIVVEDDLAACFA